MKYLNVRGVIALAIAASALAVVGVAFAATGTSASSPAFLNNDGCGDNGNTMHGVPRPVTVTLSRKAGTLNIAVVGNPAWDDANADYDVTLLWTDRKAQNCDVYDSADSPGGDLGTISTNGNGNGSAKFSVKLNGADKKLKYWKVNVDDGSQFAGTYSMTVNPPK